MIDIQDVIKEYLENLKKHNELISLVQEEIVEVGT